MRWTVTVEYDTPNDYHANKVADALFELAAAMTDGPRLARSEEKGDEYGLVP